MAPSSVEMRENFNLKLSPAVRNCRSFWPGGESQVMRKRMGWEGCEEI